VAALVSCGGLPATAVRSDQGVGMVVLLLAGTAAGATTWVVDGGSRGRGVAVVG
jgi:hypothetical protein